MTATLQPDQEYKTRPQRPGGRKGRRLVAGWHVTPFQCVAATIAVVVGICSAYPLLRVVLAGFVGNGGLSIAPITETLKQPKLSSLLLDTLLVVLSSSVLALLVGSVFAWLNERTDARLGVVTDSLPLLPFVLPPIAGAVGWVLLLAPTAGYANAVLRWVLSLVGVHLRTGPLNIYTFYGLTFVYVLYQIPYVFMLVSNGLRATDASLEEQSRVCGASGTRTFFRVTLPALRHSLGAAWLLMILQGFSLFAIPAIIAPQSRIDILSVRIVNLLTGTYPPEMDPAIGLSLIIVVLVGINWAWQSRQLRRRRFSTIGGKGRRPQRMSLGAMRRPAQALLLAYGVVAVVLPVLALLLVSLRGVWTLRLSLGDLSLHTLFSNVFGDQITSNAFRNSLTLGTIGATIAIAIAAMVSLFVYRSSRAPGRIVDGAVKLPAVFPHLVIAVGLILAFGGAPLYLTGTSAILLIAYVVIYLPEGSIASDSAVGQIGRELPEASAIAGAHEGKTFARIFLPLMIPGLAAGWAFLFVRMAGDLTASALLAGTSNMVIGFRILGIYDNGNFAELAAVSLVLTVGSAVVVTAVLALSRRIGKWQR